MCVCIYLMRAWNEKRIYVITPHMMRSLTWHHTWWHTYDDHRQIFVREIKLLAWIDVFCGYYQKLLFLFEVSWPDQYSNKGSTNGGETGAGISVCSMCLKTVIILPVLSYWNHEFGSEELLNKAAILVFFAHNNYSCIFIKLRLNHWCHMDYFKRCPITFLGLECGTFPCCLYMQDQKALRFH